MTDVFTPEQRSAVMARVKGRNTGPELAVRRLLWRAGFRYRLHRRDLPGSPDLAFIGRKLAVFVHGCFWHRHAGCRAASIPATRAEFWAEKFAANVARDARVQAALRAAGWTVHVVWECETRRGGWEAALLAALRDGPPPQRSSRTAT